MGPGCAKDCGWVTSWSVAAVPCTDYLQDISGQFPLGTAGSASFQKAARRAGLACKRVAVGRVLETRHWVRFILTVLVCQTVSGQFSGRESWVKLSPRAGFSQSRTSPACSAVSWSQAQSCILISTPGKLARIGLFKVPIFQKPGSQAVSDHSPRCWCGHLPVAGHIDLQVPWREMLSVWRFWGMWQMLQEKSASCFHWDFLP